MAVGAPDVIGRPYRADDAVSGAQTLEFVDAFDHSGGGVFDELLACPRRALALCSVQCRADRDALFVGGHHPRIDIGTACHSRGVAQFFSDGAHYRGRFSTLRRLRRWLARNGEPLGGQHGAMPSPQAFHAELVSDQRPEPFIEVVGSHFAPAVGGTVNQQARDVGSCAATIARRG